MEESDQIWSKEKLAAEVKRVLNEVPSDFGGGCPPQKAILMAELIRTFNLKLTVDIGVYRGRSLFPQALAHRGCTGGAVVGVDPWDAGHARQRDNKPIRAQLDSWTKETDFEGIYREVCAHLTRFDLVAHCQIVRLASADAAKVFERENRFFDLVHVDGNHDTRPVMADLANYLPRLRPGGFLILDDTSWSSVKPAFARAAAELDLLIHDQERDYAVFSKTQSAADKTERHALLPSLHAQAASAALS